MEVYGEKPKRFTKEWWEYFWDYYKWHTIAAIVVLVVIISTVTECATRVHYDLQLDYISDQAMSTEAQEALAALMEENIDDVTQNGKTEAYVLYLDMGERNDPQYVQAMQTKYAIEMGNTESFVFLISKDYADLLTEGEILVKAEDWCDAPSYNGYFVDLKDCTVLKDIGVNTDDLYVCIINIREKNEEKREKRLLEQENGIKFARFLIGER